MVRPTSHEAPLTMAWVVDLDGAASCGGDDAATLSRHQEAAEVMVTHGVTLEGGMEPPSLPRPFLYRPFEAGGGPLGERRRAALTSHPPMSFSAQAVRDETRYIVRVTCGACSTPGGSRPTRARGEAWVSSRRRSMPQPAAAAAAAAAAVQPATVRRPPRGAPAQV